MDIFCSENMIDVHQLLLARLRRTRTNKQHKNNKSTNILNKRKNWNCANSRDIMCCMDCASTPEAHQIVDQWFHLSPKNVLNWPLLCRHYFSAELICVAESLKLIVFCSIHMDLPREFCSKLFRNQYGTFIILASILPFCYCISFLLSIQIPPILSVFIRLRLTLAS